MKNIPKPLLILSFIALIMLVVMKLENFFMWWIMIFLTSFLVSWLAPQIFSPFLGKTMPKSGTRAILGFATIICFVAFGISDNHTNKMAQQKEKEIELQEVQKADEIAGQIIDIINVDDIDQAIILANQSTEQNLYSPKLSDIRGQLYRLRDEKFLDKNLLELTDDELNLLKDNQLEKKFLDQEKLNDLFIEKLLQNTDKRTTLFAQAEDEKKKAQEAEDQKKREEFQKEHEQKLESQFSILDGSHRNLTRFIKDSMNDPKSYDHVKTTYIDKGDYLIITTTFRGGNAFGGIVPNTVEAKVSLEGDILEILDQY
jgi:hypothetical protein